MHKNKKPGAILAFIFAGFCTSLCAAALAHQSDAAKSLQAKFDQTHMPWRGADAAYSVPFKDGQIPKSLWLFGDTFIDPRCKGRANAAFIHNTLAIDTPGQTSPCIMSFSKAATAPFADRPDGTFFWPGDGICINNRFYVFLHRVIGDKSQPDPFAFNIVADEIAVFDLASARASIESESGKPIAADYIKLDNDASKILMGTALFKQDDHLYVFAQRSSKRGTTSGATLSRIALSALQKSRSLTLADLEWWDGKNWTGDSDKAAVLFTDGPSEMSVGTLRGRKGFYALYVPDMAAGGAKALYVRHADRLQGPYSKPIRLTDLAADHPDSFCYSAKLHPEYASGDGEAIVTYCINPNDQKRLLTDDTTYRPRVRSFCLR
jgi:Domain of unknown function (DUF4185)